MPVALQLSPHPDDELIGAPATLLLLRDAGFTVVNLALSLGRREDRSRRQAELAEACQRVGFELRIAQPMAAISHSDDLREAEERLVDVIEAFVDSLKPAIVLSPSPHDGPRGHEVVGRAARRVLPGRQLRWWIWGTMAEVPLPNLITLFGTEQLDEILSALSAHTGEIKRNDYRALVRGRGEANLVRAPEVVFAFGSQGIAGQFAELLTEAVPFGTTFRLGSPRVLTSENLLAAAGPIGLDPWLDSPSPRDLVGL